MKDKLLITSGYNFEGYTITEYIGVFSGECALGTGFLSSLGAGFADFLGTNSTLYSNKLKNAKDYAMEQLAGQAVSVGGNAVIGLDIDYTTFSADIMGVIATGTVVKIKRNSILSIDSRTKITVKAASRNLPFRPVCLFVNKEQRENVLSIDIYCPSPYKVTGIIADVKFTTSFNDTYSLEYVDFIDFCESSKNHFTGTSSLQKIPDSIGRNIQSAQVIVLKYILDGRLVELSQEEVDNICEEMENCEENVAISAEELISNAETLNSAIEIAKYLKEYNEQNSGVLNPEIIDEIDKIALIERMYGNSKKSCINKLKTLLGS